MLGKSLTLPKYPVQCDVWQQIKNEKRPIVVYGMGNGADKLFERLCELGVSVHSVVASDGFVRGHSFRGYRVKSFSEIDKELSDFLLLLSFATNKPDVLEMLVAVNNKYDMLIPDMPVADTSEYFDKDFYNANYNEIQRAYNSLADEPSRTLYAAIIHFKLSGKMEYLTDYFSERDELYAALNPKRITDYVDVGAYNGDTLKEGAEYFVNLKRATLIEPDKKTFKRLLGTCAGYENLCLNPINAAAIDKVGKVIFNSSGNRNSTAAATPSHKSLEDSIDAVTVDSLNLSPDYIKYDVEGAELVALVGTHATIERARPALLVSLYHRSRDIFELVNYLHAKYPFYKLSLFRLRCVPAWEIDLVLTLA